MLELLLLLGTAFGAATGTLVYKQQKDPRPLVKRIEKLLANDGWTVWNGKEQGPLLYNADLGIVIYFEQRIDENFEFVPVAFRIVNMPVRQLLRKSERRLLREALFTQSERFLLDKQILQLETGTGV